MPNADYKRCRARVVDLWSPEPITDSSVAQRVAAELAGTLGGYPPAHAVDQRKGVWDFYLPAAAAETHERRVEIDAGGWDCTVEFLDD